MEYILINSRNLNLKNLRRLKSFENKIYLNAFPDENEREDFKDILKRIKGTDSACPSSYCVLCFENNNIAGGCIADWYPDCDCLEIIYIAIKPDSRGKGVGRGLVNKSIMLIKEELRLCGKNINHIFIEVDIPDKPLKESMDMNPVCRLMFWERMGAKCIPINYSQPPLSEGKSSADHLILMELPTSSDCALEAIQAKDLKQFLASFYNGLGAGDSNRLEEMNHEISSLSKDNGEIQLEDIFSEEQPFSKYQYVVVTSHYIFNRKDSNIPELCPKFNSYECDLMNYSCQINRPFKTTFTRIIENATLIHPDCYCYTSEGVTYYRKWKEREIKVDISISISYPKNSDKAIAHFSIRPAENYHFTDLDLIKLITPFGSRQENYQTSGNTLFKIGEECLTDVQILKKSFDGCDFIRLSEGVTQLTYHAEDEFFIRFYENSGVKVEEKVKDTKENKLLCGIILGIFDYDRMNAAEIIDTIQPIVRKKDSFMVICRGHLLMISQENDILDDILISPYLLIPSAALSINGHVLKSCEKQVEYALEHPINPFSNKVHKAEITLKNEYLAGLFQYPSEQEIISTGKKQRSMDERYNYLVSRIDIIKNRERTSSNIFIEGILLVLALFEIIGVFNGDVKFTFKLSLILSAIVLFEIIRWVKARKT